MPEISKEDRDLSQAARKKAGGVTALAQHFKVSKQTASGWGTRHPIPRHVRGLIRDYVGVIASDGTELVTSPSSSQPSQDEVDLMSSVKGREAFSLLAFIFKHRAENQSVWQRAVSDLKQDAKLITPSRRPKRRPPSVTQRHAG